MAGESTWGQDQEREPLLKKRETGQPQAVETSGKVVSTGNSPSYVPDPSVSNKLNASLISSISSSLSPGLSIFSFLAPLLAGLPLCFVSIIGDVESVRRTEGQYITIK